MITARELHHSQSIAVSSSDAAPRCIGGTFQALCQIEFGRYKPQAGEEPVTGQYLPIIRCCCRACEACLHMDGAAEFPEEAAQHVAMYSAGLLKCAQPGC